jgi:hypothetical protein
LLVPPTNITKGDPQPFVESDLLVASIVLMWVAAVLSALIDNIPFTAAMVPIILGFEAQGINVTPLWWRNPPRPTSIQYSQPANPIQQRAE